MSFSYIFMWIGLISGLGMIWYGAKPKPRNRYLKAADRSCKRNSTEAVP